MHTMQQTGTHSEYFQNINQLTGQTRIARHLIINSLNSSGPFETIIIDTLTQPLNQPHRKISGYLFEEFSDSDCKDRSLTVLNFILLFLGTDYCLRQDQQQYYLLIKSAFTVTNNYWEDVSFFISVHNVQCLNILLKFVELRLS